MDKITDEFDVVILGSGLGGLASGAILSKEGLKVCILEKNEQIGGNLQTFNRDGVKFDTGVHYIGGLDKGQNLYKLFNYFGIMDRLKLQKMDPTGFDVVLFKDDVKEYPYGMGYDNFIRIMTEAFPDEEGAIIRYCDELKRICMSFPLYNLRFEEGYQDQEIFTRGVKEFIDGLTGNEKLRSVLAGTNFLYAGIADKTPLYIHALVVNSYIESAYRCVVGGDQIAKLLAKEIKANGGLIKRSNGVTRIHITDDRVEYVELENGQLVRGKNFISNIHPAQTLDMIDAEKLRPAYKDRISKLENTVSAFTLFAVLKPGRRKYLNRNYYYFTENDVWNTADYTTASWPRFYGLFECIPKHQKEYSEGLSIISYMHYEEVKEWENTVNTVLDEGDRGETYEAFKKAKAEKLLSVVEEKFPGITDDIESYYCATPLSYRDYIGTNDGNIYGVVKNFKDFMVTSVSPRTKIANLLFVGQNVNLHGILGVSVSAVITCSFLIGREYLINKIAQAYEEVA
jgi:phytoene dehydrogenase-like protein